ncbi:MAG: CAP domain-containing protein [Actinomycetota bacterium]
MTYRRLPLLVVVVAVLVAGMPSPADAGNVTRRNKTLHLLNQTRRDHGLREFRLNLNLSRDAWRHSKRMAEKNRCFHTADLYDVVRTYSPSTWGENVGAAGTLRRIRNLWMRSAGHRANILNPRFRRIGIGVVKARGLLWVTTIFYGG